MAGTLERKPILFTLAVVVTVLVGSIATMAYPMLRPDMHPQAGDPQALHAAAAGRARRLPAGELPATPHPDGARRCAPRCCATGTSPRRASSPTITRSSGAPSAPGPTWAREGGKRPDAWHVAHYENPQAIAPRSNMPTYRWLKTAKLDLATVKAHMDALGIRPYTAAQIAELAGKTELDALVAYTQQLGHAVAEAARPRAAVDLAGSGTRSAPRRRPIAAGQEALRGELRRAATATRGTAASAPSFVRQRLPGRAGLRHGRRRTSPSSARAATRRRLIGAGPATDGGMECLRRASSARTTSGRIVSWIRAQQAHEGKESPAHRGEGAPSSGGKH